MNYNTIRVKGFPRSGNHYLASLISINFFGSDEYVGLFGNRVHVLPKGVMEEIKSKDIIIIYIYRDFKDVANSVFVMRNRFGLDVSSIDNMLSNNLCDMWCGNLEVNMHVTYKDKPVTVVASDFRNINSTLEEYWKKHVDSWKKMESDSVVVVKYEDMLQDFSKVLCQFFDDNC